MKLGVILIGIATIFNSISIMMMGRKRGGTGNE